MSVDQYVIKEVPTTLSQIVPCLVDLGKAALDLQISPEESELVPVAASNVASLGIYHGVQFVSNGPNVIGDTPEDLRTSLDDAIALCKAVQSTDPAAIDPATILVIIQIAAKLFELWRNRRKG